MSIWDEVQKIGALIGESSDWASESLPDIVMRDHLELSNDVVRWTPLAACSAQNRMQKTP